MWGWILKIRLSLPRLTPYTQRSSRARHWCLPQCPGQVEFVNYSCGASENCILLAPLGKYVLLLLLLFEIRNRIVPTGSTPEGGPTEVSPTTQATRHPRALLLFMFPIPPYLLSCILHPVSPLPRPPVLYRYPTKYLVCPLPVFLSYKTPHI